MKYGCLLPRMDGVFANGKIGDMERGVDVGSGSKNQSFFAGVISG